MLDAKRIQRARKRMGKVTLVKTPNRLRKLRLEASRVLDTRGATRVTNPSKWVQSYIALRA